MSEFHHVSQQEAALDLVREMLKTSRVRVTKQSDTPRCPFFIMRTDHFREDGTCKCDDPQEQLKMRSWGYTPTTIKKALKKQGRSTLEVQHD